MQQTDEIVRVFYGRFEQHPLFKEGLTGSLQIMLSKIREDAFCMLKINSNLPN